MDEDIPKPAIELVKKNLNQTELAAYNRCIGRNDPPLSKEKANEFYALFQLGKSCEQIQQGNPQFYLGQIVQARINYAWDERKFKHLHQLQTETMARLHQATLESIKALSDRLMAASKAISDKSAEYVQTGDPNIAEELSLYSPKIFKELVESLQKLTGAEQNKKISGEIVHTVQGDDGNIIDSKISPATASKLLKILANGEDEE